MVQSRVTGFYTWPLATRRKRLSELLGWDVNAFKNLNPEALSLNLADKLIENVIGVLGLPVGLGLNLVVNGEDVLVPMAIEEPSVVAAFSNAAKMSRAGGGFHAEADPSIMIGQIQLAPPTAADAAAAVKRLEDAREAILRSARTFCEPMEQRGGGVRGLEIRLLKDPDGLAPIVVVHILIDVVDAMGANIVNHVCESIAPLIEQTARIDVNLRILSNLASRRLARVRARIPVAELGGMEIAERIQEADRFARLDPYRAATHNKGIMNGIDAVALATGNDWRAIEAGAHAWAAKDGTYRGLTRWTLDRDEQVLRGEMELPLAVGTVGGTTRCHPTIDLLRQLIGVEDARRLAGVFAAVGLAQNLAALRALAAEGIQKGHMALHARQLALAAGASHAEVDEVAQQIVKSGKISAEGARAALGTSDPLAN